MGFVFFYSIEKREKNLDCGERELADVAKAKSAWFLDLKVPLSVLQLICVLFRKTSWRKLATYTCLFFCC